MPDNVRRLDASKICNETSICSKVLVDHRKMLQEVQVIRLRKVIQQGGQCHERRYGCDLVIIIPK